MFLIFRKIKSSPFYYILHYFQSCLLDIKEVNVKFCRYRRKFSQKSKRTQNPLSTCLYKIWKRFLLVSRMAAQWMHLYNTFNEVYRCHDDLEQMQHRLEVKRELMLWDHLLLPWNGGDWNTKWVFLNKVNMMTSTCFWHTCNSLFCTVMTMKRIHFDQRTIQVRETHSFFFHFDSNHERVPWPSYSLLFESSSLTATFLIFSSTTTIKCFFISRWVQKTSYEDVWYLISLSL